MSFHCSKCSNNYSNTQLDIACTNAALETACTVGDAYIVDFLLDTCHSEPSFIMLRAAVSHRHWAVVEHLLKDGRIDPSCEDNFAIYYAANWGSIDTVKMLLLDKRVDPTVGLSGCRSVLYNGYNVTSSKLVDILIADLRTNLQTVALIDGIWQVHTRMGTVCIGLQDLQLPALVTLEILDALVPNDIRMAAKWELVVAVKHFHERCKND